MSTLFIRNVPEKLHIELKVRAVKEKKSLQVLCIELLTEAVKGSKKQGGKR